MNVTAEPGSVLAGVGLMRTPGEVVLAAWVPVPLRVTVAVDPEDALLVSVKLPVAVPAAVGLNCTFTL